MTSVADAYAHGRIHFMGIELLVAPGALVPREETELLGRTAVNVLSDGSSKTVIDMCCGAGNLACAIAHHVPTACVWASDLTDGCVTLTRRNVDMHGLQDRVTVRQGDLFAPLADDALEGKVDAVVCNPPYISEKRLSADRAELLEHEPREAFAAGPYGLSIHMRVARDALAFLKPGGTLMFEVGHGQAPQVKSVLDRTKGYEDIQIINDAAGEGRVVTGRKK